MTLSQAIELAKKIVDEQRKGQFVNATWHTEQNPARAHKGTMLARTTTSVVRLGIDYANLHSIKESIANNERGPVGSLFVGNWIFFPFVIKSNTGKHLFRIYQNIASKLNTVFYVNGKIVDESEYVKYLTPSDRKTLENRHNRVCFSVNIENLKIS